MRRGLPLALAACLLSLPRPLPARYETARALGKRCSACHDTHRPAIENLNAAGRYFLANQALPGALGAQAAPPASPRPPDAPAPAPSAEASPAPSGAPPAAARPRSGQPLFARNCAPCHGPKGEGTEKARPLVPPQRAATEKEVEALVRDGIEGTGMFPFKDVLSAEQIRAVSGYVQTLRGR